MTTRASPGRCPVLPRPAALWRRVLAVGIAWVGMGLGVGAELPWLLEPLGGAGRPVAVRHTGGSGEAGPTTRIPVGLHDPGSGVVPMPGDRWRVPTPDGGSEVLQVTRMEPAGSGGWIGHGRLEGRVGSEVLWVLGNRRMAGLFRRGDGRRWQVVPSEGGGHRLEEWAGQQRAVCGNGRGGSEDGDGMGMPRRALQDMGGSTETQVLDLLLLCTPAARAGAGGDAGFRALVELSVVEANDAFERSAIRLRLRIAGVTSVDYEESGDLTTDLGRLTRSGDGWLDQVAALRDAHAADLVCLVTESEDTHQYAGMANQLRSLEMSALERGFTVCLRPFLVGNYTLAHEIGHLLGGNHDRETSLEGGLLPAAYGARFTVDGQVYRTVMAYRPGIQVPHFSNPDVLFRGVPTGVFGRANNAETLNWVAPRMAQVRERPGRVEFAVSTLNVGEADGRGRVRVLCTGTAGAGEVRVRTRDGSARAGTDYEAVDSRLAWAGEEGELGVSVGLLDTPAREGSRGFWLEMEAPSTGWALGSRASVWITIRDDETEAGVLLDTSFRPESGADHAVRAVAVGEGDVLYAGGSFEGYDGERRPRVARVLANGRVDPGFLARVKYQVNAVVPLGDGRVAIGGDFNTVNDVRMNHVAVLRPDGGLDPRFQFEEGSDLAVMAMALTPEDGLVIGGQFTTVDGVAALRVARLRGDGTLDAGFDTRAGADDDVNAVLVDAQGWTLIGGRFRRVNGQARGGVARLDKGGRLDGVYATGGGADGVIWAMALDGRGRVVVAGEFARFDGKPAGGMVRLNEVGRRDESFRAEGGSGADGAIRAVLCRGDGSIWVAGGFTAIDGVPRSRVARLLEDGRLDASFDPGWGPNDEVMALAERWDGGLVLGGIFTEVMGISRPGIAVLMSELLPPVRFESVGRAGGSLIWGGRGWPRQRYAVERSLPGSGWRLEGEVAAPDGELRGVIPIGAERSGLVRLRRVLE